MIRIVRRRMIINMKDGSAFSCLLWRRGRRLLQLRDVTLFAEGQTRPVDGEVVIERRDVAFMQLTAIREPT